MPGNFVTNKYGNVTDAVNIGTCFAGKSEAV